VYGGHNPNLSLSSINSGHSHWLKSQKHHKKKKKLQKLINQRQVREMGLILTRMILIVDVAPPANVVTLAGNPLDPLSRLYL